MTQFSDEIKCLPKLYRIRKVAEVENPKVKSDGWENHVPGSAFNEGSLPIEYEIEGYVKQFQPTLKVARITRNGVLAFGHFETSQVKSITNVENRYTLDTDNSRYLIEQIEPAIKYVTGNAVAPERVQEHGDIIIAHVCNDIGAWGKGFVVAISDKWEEPEARYREWSKSGRETYKLGGVQVVGVGDQILVANMIGQRSIYNDADGTPPIRYDALDLCLNKLADQCQRRSIREVHMPRIGCGLAGGEWSKVEPLIKHRLSSKGIHVVVYDFVGGKFNA